MYNEFVITMTTPAVGLAIIYGFYRRQRWKNRQSATATEVAGDTEKGALQKQDLDDTYVAALRRNRDLCVWLAIGWLFMVKHLCFDQRV